ncbi:hypothetical protein [Methylobacterium flocculans]|uniref:hypothetical protein n=1 Tax=Methylobacterium flocculans TaxID=2984843 RepID=UPI0021F3008E|nr:hypothetical protein [Methylobacterium sp. FF17]
MKVLGGVVALGLILMGPALAQPYGYREDGYRNRYEGRDEGYRDRGSRYDDRDDRRRFGEDEGRGRRGRGGDVGFDEGDYLRCNPDVRRAVERGQMPSGAVHFQKFGRREGRRLSC